MKYKIIVILVVIAAATSHFVQPYANSPISKVILVTVMTIGFLWPIGMLISVRALIMAIRDKRVSLKQTGRLLLAVLFAPLAIFAYVPPEGIFLFNPNIDTRYSPGFSEIKFSQVRIGMSEDEVTQLLGQPLAASDGYNQEYDSLWSYTGDGACYWSDFAWKHKWIMMKERKVQNVSSGWSYD